MTETNLSERGQSLLKTLIERYIREGQPVGSHTLARDSNLDLSPATVRNIIADLEKLGLVQSPHTSAGRIPTDQGYRLFIDNLLTVKPLEQQEIQELEQHIDTKSDAEGIFESASSLLSGITKMAGVVMLPTKQQISLRQIEFLPLSGQRVLAVLVFSERDVQNRIIHTNRTYSADELRKISNCLNSEFLGKNIKQVRKHLLGEMTKAKDAMDKIMISAIEMANKVFQDDGSTFDYVLAGETNLMHYGEMSDITRLRQLFEAFNEKRGLLYLLDKTLKAPGIQIFVGNESGDKSLDDCSFVTASYSANNEVIGALGVIGPTRMAYDRVIPLVEITAKLLGSVLDQNNA